MVQGVGMSEGWVPTPRHGIQMAYSWQAGSKYPTGMLSCIHIFLVTGTVT